LAKNREWSLKKGRGGRFGREFVGGGLDAVEKTEIEKLATYVGAKKR